ncbi:hypothetical protein ACWJPR_27105, partial [Klebsiella pneumoniae]
HDTGLAFTCPRASVSDLSLYSDTFHQSPDSVYSALLLKWFTEFGHLNRGDMLTSEQHRCHNEKKKFQRRV